MEQIQQQGSDSEKFITSSMLSFLNKHIQSAQLNNLDEIILSYVVRLLESLAAETGNLEDSFDVGEFCEMLTAYFPEFTNIPKNIVCEWIFELVASLKELVNKDKPKREQFLIESLLSDIEPERSQRSERNSESSAESNYSSNDNSCSSSASSSVRGSTSRSPRTSETGDFGSEAELSDAITKLQITQDQFEEYCSRMLEIFPDLTLADVSNALLMTTGDLDKAVEHILTQIEEETAPRCSTSTSVGKFVKNPANLVRLGQVVKGDDIDDKKALKERICARYGYVDEAEDKKKEFRPPPLKPEPQKLVRYRDSQVVSTTGDRYSVVPCEDGGEINIHKPNKNN